MSDQDDKQARERREESAKVKMDFFKHIYLVSSAMMIFIGGIFPGVPSCPATMLKICAALFLVSIVCATVALFIDTANFGLWGNKKKMPPDEYKTKRCAFSFSVLTFALGCIMLFFSLFLL